MRTTVTLDAGDLEPAARHLGTVGTLLTGVGAGGDLVDDAHLAALAVEHGATVVSWDNDVGRFPGVSWTSPPSL